MGIAYRLDPRLGCAFVVWDRNVTPDVWRAHFDQMFSDPMFPPGRRLLVDLSTAGEAPSITAEIIEEMGKRFNAESEALTLMRLAMIPNGNWEKAVQLIDHEVSVPGLQGMFFNELSVACTWLGLAVNDVRPILEDLRAGLRGT